jgi:DNA-binding response OmpR family regulator
MGAATELVLEYRRCRELIERAEEILIHERAFSADEAHRCLYELAVAGKLFITEVADRIVRGEGFWAPGSQGPGFTITTVGRLSLVRHSTRRNGGMMSQLSKILLVDDEPAITDNLAPFLRRAGFTVAAAADGEKALHQMATFTPDLIVLDVLMPKLDGREVLRRLRREDNWTPVIMLTQVGEATERAMALEEGADDYLNKPFDPHELVARIRAVLRRSQPGQPPLTAAECLASGGLLLNRRSRRAWFDCQELALTPKAMALLEYLMTHPDELLTRDRLLDAVWGWDYPAGIRAVDTRIAELRRALGDDPAQPGYIETVQGQGYRFIGSVRAVP